MEHVNDVPQTYSLLRKWLRPGGLMSHSIDYSSHSYTRDWNGHWTIPAPLWRVVAGNRKFCINRMPHSEHLRSMKSAGFQVTKESINAAAALARDALALEFRQLTEADLGARCAFVQALAG